MFDHLLESYHRDDSYKWSNIGFGQETKEWGSIEINFTHLIWSSDKIMIFFYLRISFPSSFDLLASFFLPPPPNQPPNHPASALSLAFLAPRLAASTSACWRRIVMLNTSRNFSPSCWTIQRNFDSLSMDNYSTWLIEYIGKLDITGVFLPFWTRILVIFTSRYHPKCVFFYIYQGYS